MSELLPGSSASNEADPQTWLRTGLQMLHGIPDGLEGGIRMQQASLSLDQALRCGLSQEELVRSLKQWMAAQLAELRATLDQG